MPSRTTILLNVPSRTTKSGKKLTSAGFNSYLERAQVGAQQHRDVLRDRLADHRPRRPLGERSRGLVKAVEERLGGVDHLLFEVSDGLEDVLGARRDHVGCEEDLDVDRARDQGRVLAPPVREKDDAKQQVTGGLHHIPIAQLG